VMLCSELCVPNYASSELTTNAFGNEEGLWPET